MSTRHSKNDFSLSHEELDTVVFVVIVVVVVVVAVVVVVVVT